VCVLFIIFFVSKLSKFLEINTKLIINKYLLLSAKKGIKPTAMNEFKSKEKILDLFSRIGYTLNNNEIIDEIFYKASQSSGGNGNLCTINSFRDVLNQYLIQKKIFLDKK
jgi:hypothetical protein